MKAPNLRAQKRNGIFLGMGSQIILCALCVLLMASCKNPQLPIGSYYENQDTFGTTGGFYGEEEE